MNNIEKYLPLGTIVLLKNGKHKAMVVGFCAKIADDSNAPFYDYIGCLWPEGIFTTDETLVFNHEDIEKIYHVGFSNSEVKEFNNKIKEVMRKMYSEE